MSTCSDGNGDTANSSESRKRKKQRRSQRRLCKSSTKIAIIGSGPSGLSAALSLQQAGYQNIHLYERDEHFNARKDGVSSFSIHKISCRKVKALPFSRDSFFL